MKYLLTMSIAALITLTFSTSAFCAPNTESVHTKNIYANSGLKYNEVIDFVKTMRADISDPIKFASIVYFPARIAVGNDVPIITTRKLFIKYYKKIITPHIRDIIKNQDLNTMISRSDGIGMGDGEIWFTGICPDATCSSYTIYIVTIQ